MLLHGKTAPMLLPLAPPRVKGEVVAENVQGCRLTLSAEGKISFGFFCVTLGWLFGPTMDEPVSFSQFQRTKTE